MSNSDQHQPGYPTVGHVSSIPQLFIVFGALVALTILTVVLSGRLPGSGGMMIAMGIATIKAFLVALYFMHLRYDRPFHGYVFLASLMFVACFFGILSLDSAAYRMDILPYEEANYQDKEAAFPRHTSPATLHTTDEAADAEAETPADTAEEATH